MNLSRIRAAIADIKHAPEHPFIQALVSAPALSRAQRRMVSQSSMAVVRACRQDIQNQTLLDSFLQEFGLSNKEGVALMCLAEALLRIPDKGTADRLIAEKITGGDWASHKGNSASLFVNSATWGMILTGKLVHLDRAITEQSGRWLTSLTSKLSEAVVRRAILQAMRIMAGQYVLGRSIEEGLKNSSPGTHQPSHYSFDMLGEAARTQEDAERYFSAYSQALEHIGHANTTSDIYAANSISVKLSALHPQYQFSHYHSVMYELLPKIIHLSQRAKLHNISLTIDAEEASKLDMSLDIFESLARHPELSDWNGLGFVLQAYQKRAPKIVGWLVQLAKETNRKIQVRLVKGAYWDAEIKIAQELGLDDYPVFTRKAHTDVCYLHCAQLLLEAKAYIYPQFATHNAYSAIAVSELASGLGNSSFEFQRLHGMGALLYKHLHKHREQMNLTPPPLRLYAPIGQHADLLPYLVRRLLENGANSSFVNRFLDDKMPVDKLIVDLYDEVNQYPNYRHSKIPLPKALFQHGLKEKQRDKRKNAIGIDLTANATVEEINKIVEGVYSMPLEAQPIIAGASLPGKQLAVLNPSHLNAPAGQVTHANSNQIELALSLAAEAQSRWRETKVSERASMLNKMADLLELEMFELIGIITREAGRTITDGTSEVREAIDFCRYYAQQAVHIQSERHILQGRGTFFCISPWNFPLAIFVGQVAAALVSGNCVLAKPAEQTPIIAFRAVKLFHQAGCPVNVLHLITGDGPSIGAQVIPDPRISGIVFTGSTQTARLINLQISERPGHGIPLIAETGGQNCMIADSTALPEQLVDDLISSAFHSAGQRCSALRVLYVQDVIADKIIHMLRGAMALLVVSNPKNLSTDVGPVIDQQARESLQHHIDYIQPLSKLSLTTPISASLKTTGFFFPPRVFEIESIDALTREVFGPVLHLIRYRAEDLDQILRAINDTGYGLTLGIHSRIETFANYVFNHTHAGNTYINRNMIGAVVGVNPFGGTGLSGTGPKAGGPHYLYRFMDLANKPPAEQNQSTQGQKFSQGNSSSAEKIIFQATTAHQHWSAAPVGERIEKITDSIQPHQADERYDKQIHSLLETCRQKLEKPLQLPGPTGEDNQLHLVSRGPVLIIVDENDKNQDLTLLTVLVLACGNSVVLQSLSKTAEHLIQQVKQGLDKHLPSDVLQCLHTTNISAAVINSEIRVAAIVCSNPHKHTVRKKLASRKGAITPMLEFTGDFSHPQQILFYLTYLVIERTKTDNLVARGGNTQLFNLEE